jgi:hypothetical protein
MTYELSTLEMLCSQTLSSDAAGDFNGDKILEEVQRIKKEWRITACMPLEAKTLQTYIRQHQISLLILIEELHNSHPAEANICNILEDLLIFLLDSFMDFIDMNMSIPVYALPATKRRLETNIERFEAFAREATIPEGLSNIISKPIHKFLQNSNLLIHFYQLRFITLLEKNLLDLSHHKLSKEKIIIATINGMCYINYNSSEVYELVKQLIKAEADEKDNAALKINFLKSILLHFKHMPVKQGAYYKPDNRLLARSVADWIERMVNRQNTPNEIDFKEIEDPEIENTTKLMTSLSIEELALMVRLSVETGVIRTKRNGLKGLSRFMARHTRTLTKGLFDEYKAETFYKYYYTVSTVNISSVKSILKRMLRKLEDIEGQSKPIASPVKTK